MDPWLIYLCLALPIFLIALHTLIRVIRSFYKFPMPHILANLIDNPVRRKLQPPDKTALRHGIMPGMNVLEVGPGSCRYTLASAKRVGEGGKLVTIDIEPRIIDRIQEIVEREGIKNIEARVANVYDLPYQDGTFDLIYMIAVIGEIPEPIKAMKEFSRVLSPEGALVFSEIFSDPDYPLSKTLMEWARIAGFQLKRKMGNILYYTLIFEKILSEKRQGFQ